MIKATILGGVIQDFLLSIINTHLAIDFSGNMLMGNTHQHVQMLRCLFTKVTRSSKTFDGTYSDLPMYQLIGKRPDLQSLTLMQNDGEKIIMVYSRGRQP